jgi:enamine deaminase RidA (YjgF/YER057c/UK114 family)
VLKALSHPDAPHGLIFSLGHLADAGTGMVFIGSSTARDLPHEPGSFHDQSVDSIDFIVDAASSISPDARITKVRRYMTSGRGHRDATTRELWLDRFGQALPASTALEVPGSSLLDSVMDLEAWAAVPSDALPSCLVRADFADGSFPRAVAVRGDQAVVTAAVSAERRGSLEAEIEECLAELTAVFGRHGATDSDVAQLTVYYRDPRVWPMLRRTISARFGRHSPAVTDVIVSNFADRGTRVALSGWARCGDSEMTTTVGKTARIVNLRDQVLYSSGTGAIGKWTGGQSKQNDTRIPPATIVEQAHVSMTNQSKILESAGLTLSDVFQSTWYMTDIRDWAEVEPILRDYFEGDLPASLVVEVSRLTAKPGVRFEPDFWASRSSDA